jgi:PKD repeat protein
MHSHATYTIYWAPPEPNGQPKTSFVPFPLGPPDYKATINNFLLNVAADSGRLSNVYSVDLQYGELSPGAYSSAFGGTFNDVDLYPARDTTHCPISSNNGADGLPVENQPCITDAQIRTELKTFIAAHSLPTGLAAMYFVLTPQDVNSCANFTTGIGCNTNVYCAYHSNTAAVPLLIYANMPYDHVPGCETPAEPNSTPADDEINTLSHEHNEAVTDPEGNAWFDGAGNEVGDRCTTPFFNPLEDSNESTDAYGLLLGSGLGSPAYNQLINGGHYLLQREWSNAAGGCVTQAPVPVASFAVYSSPATVGHAVAFNGSSSSPSAGAITSYRWEFGDGQTATGAEVTHTYESTGQFTVSLTVTNDSGASGATFQTATVSPRSSTESQTTVTTTVTTPAPPRLPSETVTTQSPALRAFTADQVAGLIGIPHNGAKLSSRGMAGLGHAECPPACSVALRLYATVRTTKHHRSTVKRVLIGTLTTTVAAKEGTRSLALTLNAAGRKLLAKSRALPVQLSVTVVGQEGGAWQINRSLTLVTSGAAAKRGSSHG